MPELLVSDVSDVSVQDDEELFDVGLPEREPEPDPIDLGLETEPPGEEEFVDVVLPELEPEPLELGLETEPPGLETEDTEAGEMGLVRETGGHSGCNDE